MVATEFSETAQAIMKTPLSNRVSTSRLSRRAALKGSSSLAACATSLLVLGKTFSGRAWAQSSKVTSESVLANPYAAAMNTGPSSAAVPEIGYTVAAPGTPYLKPVAKGWSSTSLLTAGNDASSYTMTGLPDGLGAFDNGDGTITVLMNHEIDAGHGVIRGHGGKGAFVSRWVVDKTTLQVRSGRDFVAAPEKFYLWRDGKWLAGDPEPERLSTSIGCVLLISRRFRHFTIVQASAATTGISF